MRKLFAVSLLFQSACAQLSYENEKPDGNFISPLADKIISNDGVCVEDLTIFNQDSLIKELHASDAHIILIGDGNHLSPKVRETVIGILKAVKPDIFAIEGLEPHNRSFNTAEAIAEMDYTWDRKDGLKVTEYRDVLMAAHQGGSTITGIDHPLIAIQLNAIDQYFSQNFNSYKAQIGAKLDLLESKELHEELLAHINQTSADWSDFENSSKEVLKSDQRRLE